MGYQLKKIFEGFWSDFRREYFRKSAMFKTMGYSPGFLLKNGRFSTIAIVDTNGRGDRPKSTQTVAERVKNHF